MKQKGLAPILIVLVIAVFFIVFSFLFLATPHKVSGKPIAPFKNGELILSEKITYLFKKPEVGDRIVFFPTTQGIDFVGVVTNISDDKDVKIYTVLSGGSKPWSITQDKIISRVYFPFISKEEILANLPSPYPSPTTPSPTPQPSLDIKLDETGKFKIYTNNEYHFSFQYPANLFEKVGSDEKSISFLEKSDSKEAFRFGLSIADNPENLDLQEFAEKTKPIPYDRINKDEEYRVNQYDALIRRSELPCFDCENRTIEDKTYRVAIKGNKMVVSFYIVTYRYGDTSVVISDERWLNQILSTFKFTQ